MQVPCEFDIISSFSTLITAYWFSFFFPNHVHHDSSCISVNEERKVLSLSFFFTKLVHNQHVLFILVTSWAHRLTILKLGQEVGNACLAVWVGCFILDLRV